MFALFVLGGAGWGTQPTPQLQPNVILVLADDLGAADISPELTPNLERMKTRGVTFPNCYSSPVCSPTRYSILTGRYAHRDHMGTILVPRGVLNTPDSCNPEMSVSLLTLPEVLASRGYTNAAFGKWHLSHGIEPGHSEADVASFPLVHGFDFYRAGTLFGVGDYYFWERVEDGEVVGIETRYNTDVVFESAESLWREVSGPKFWYIAPQAVHDPFHAPPGYSGATDNRSLYEAMLRYLDQTLGSFLLRLHQDGELDNTYVLFLGDNGTPSDAVAAGVDPTRVKGSVYEGGVRVPCIAFGTGIPESIRGREVPGVVNTTDLFATVAELAGLDLTTLLPENYAIDSVSFASAFCDPAFVGDRVFAQSRVYGPSGFCPPVIRSADRTMVREGKYKLLKRESELFLFDLEDDPSELEPLDPFGFSPEEQAVWDRLSGQMVEFENLEPDRAYCRVAKQVGRTLERFDSVDELRVFLSELGPIRAAYDEYRDVVVSESIPEFEACKAVEDTSLPATCQWTGDWTADLERFEARIALVSGPPNRLVPVIVGRALEENGDPIPLAKRDLVENARDFGLEILDTQLEEQISNPDEIVALRVVSFYERRASRGRSCE